MVRFKKNRKGTILPENLVFIILNLVFLTILILFIVRHASADSNLEESYAKNIALLIDSAQPEMILKLNMKNAMKSSEENNIDFSEAVRINGNEVSVKLSKDGGTSYGFFNNVNVNVYPDEENGGYNGLYVLVISEK